MAQRLLSIPPLYKQGWYKCGVPDAQWTGTSHTDTHTHTHTYSHTHTHTRQFAVHCLLLKSNSLVCVDALMSSITTACSSDHFTSVAHDISCIFVRTAVWTYTRPNSKVDSIRPALDLVYCSSSLLFAGFHEIMVGLSCLYFLQMALVSCVLCLYFHKCRFVRKIRETKSWEQNSKYGILGAWAVVNTLTEWLIQSAAMATTS